MDTSQSKFKKLGKAAALGLGAAGAAGAVAILKTGFDELKSSQLVAAQLEAVIKSTGGAAGVTAFEVDKLSSSLMRKSGVDDEAIKSGANMLLTFTKIRNEAGKGNDVFTQSTKTLLDMSVATGQAMPKAAVMLGKALNDPIKGVSALARVGVTFTEGQKLAIKAMAEAGDAAGAQKLILAELQKEFGGSAEAAGKTMAGQMNVAKESFANLSGELVQKMLPVINEVLVSLLNFVAWAEVNLPRFVAAVTNVVAGAKLKFEQLRDNTLGVVHAIRDFFLNLPGNMLKVFKENWPILFLGPWWILWKTGLLEKFYDVALKPVVEVIAGLPGALWGAVQSAWHFFFDPLKAAFVGVRDWARDHWKEILIVAIGGIPGALWVAFHSKWGKEFLGKIKQEFLDVRDWIKEKIVDAIVKFFADLPDRVADAAKGLGQGVIDKLNPFNGSELGARITGPAASVVAGLGSITSVGAQHGLIVTSGFRPGDPGDHGRGKAVDLSNTYRGDPDGTPQMLSAFAALASLAPRLGIKDLLYTPGLSAFGFNIDNGRRAAFSVAGHTDHIHASVFDKGGFLQPGWNLAYNGLGRPEPVGRAGGVEHHHHYNGPVIQDQKFLEYMNSLAVRYNRRNGPGTFGSLR